MIKSIVLVISIFFIASISHAGKVIPTIPVEIDSVQTKRISESLVRIIEYNTELKQSLVIERMQTPDLKVVDKLEISQVSFGNKIIDFKIMNIGFAFCCFLTRCIMFNRIATLF